MPPSSAEPQPVILTTEEEVTLRRVAFGQSEVRAMRAADLAKLRKLRLIEDSKDGPRLTAAGKRHFEGLPKATALTKSGAGDDMLAEMSQLLKAARR